MARVEQCLLWVLFAVTMYAKACMAADCGNNVTYTINVDVNGKQQFSSIQKAIDSVPSGNNKWIRIFVSQGTYTEKVQIPLDKGCIYIEGEVEGQTIIQWGDHGSVTESPTFTAYPDNIAAKNIVFKNTFLLATDQTAKITQAPAARLQGDKYSFYKCKFIGLQDTLWDVQGRHYFKQCYVSGAIDFIWGSGQSIHEGCALDVTLRVEKLRIPSRQGTVTAQGRNSENETNGFVFKWCTVTGDRMLLGRAYRPYSRVIFYQSHLPHSLLPQGWDAWDTKGRENTITYVEAQNSGPGANTAKRVPWMKHMSQDELNKFVNLPYIDQDGWISKLPPGALA